MEQAVGELEKCFTDVAGDLDILEQKIRGLFDDAPQSDQKSTPWEVIQRLSAIEIELNNVKAQSEKLAADKNEFDKQITEIITSTASSLAELSEKTGLALQPSYINALTKYTGVPVIAPAVEPKHAFNDDNEDATSQISSIAPSQISEQHSITSASLPPPPIPTLRRKNSNKKVFIPISMERFEKVSTLVRGRIVTIDSINKMYRMLWDHCAGNNQTDVITMSKLVQLGIKPTSKTGQSHIQTLASLGVIKINQDNSVEWLRQ